MVKITIDDGGNIFEMTCEHEGFAFTTARPLTELPNGPMNFHVSGNLVAVSPMPEMIERRPMINPPVPGASDLQSRTV